MESANASTGPLTTNKEITIKFRFWSLGAPYAQARVDSASPSKLTPARRSESESWLLNCTPSGPFAESMPALPTGDLEMDARKLVAKFDGIFDRTFSV